MKMAIKLKQIYVCDGCGTEYENPDQIRVFADQVLNGDKTKNFIRPEQMYCINCLPFALDFENHNPETVIKNPETNLDRSKEDNINLRLETLESFKQETLKNLELVAENIKKSTTNTKHLADNFSNLKQSIEHVKKEFEDFVNNQDKFLEEGGTESFDSSSLEPEITNEENDSVTAQEELSIDNLLEIDPECLKDSGEFLVLCQIKTPALEKYFAKEVCKYDKLDTLKEVMGNKSLMGVYFSTNRYLDVDDISGFRQKTAKVINKIIFNIPNINELDIYLVPGSDLAVIPKRNFDIVVEPIPKYEIQEELPKKPKEIKPSQPTITKTFKDPIKDIVPFAPKLKKKISNFSISNDDYV